MSLVAAATVASTPARPAQTLSVAVVAHNEETQLAACLAQLGFADEIVVLLDRCTDGSREIASRFTDRILEGAWEREAPRRQAAVAACSGDVLDVDADGGSTPNSPRNPIRRRKFGRLAPDPVDNCSGEHLVRWG
jgi:hypothetical protein